jgi:histidinol phosphatase-like enzyme
MCAELAAAGAVLTGGYYCPHDLLPACTCRKPAPGLLLQAAREHDISFADSWMIGDSASDIEAGKRAGCRTARILADSEPDSSGADVAAESLNQAVQQILKIGSRVSLRHSS